MERQSIRQKFIKEFCNDNNFEIRWLRNVALTMDDLLGRLLVFIDSIDSDLESSLAAERAEKEQLKSESEFLAVRLWELVAKTEYYTSRELQSDLKWVATYCRIVLREYRNQLMPEVSEAEKEVNGDGK